MGIARVRVVAAVVLAACGSSSDKPVDLDAERREIADTACPAVTVPTFFSIEKDGVTSYLLGSRHAGVRLDKFPAYVKDKIASSTVVVGEADLDHPPRTPGSKPTKRTSELLGPEDWGHLEKLLGDEAAAQIDAQSPVFAIAILSLFYEDTQQRLDFEIEKMFKAAGKPIIGLEDDKRTDEIADKMLGVEALREMLQQVHSLKAIEASTRQDLAMYCRGDYRTPDSFDPIRRMSLERNEDWIPKLLPILQKGGALIVVGRDHVVSKGGLVELLRREGYRVRLVKD